MGLELDQAKLEAFGGHALDILNKGAVAVMMSVGHNWEAGRREPATSMCSPTG